MVFRKWIKGCPCRIKLNNDLEKKNDVHIVNADREQYNLIFFKSFRCTPAKSINV